MKIIICALNLYGGGAERVASLWAKGFHEQGHDVTMFLAENKVTYDIPELPIVTIGNGQSPLKQYFSWYRIFKDQFKIIKPDIFISVNHPWAPIAKLAAIGTNIKVVSTEHNAYEKPEYVKMSFMDKLHKFYLNKFVDIVTVLTNADKEYIGNRLKNVHVLHNPLTFIPASEVPSKEKTILAVGRLDSWHVKGFDLLIKAWGRLAEEFPEWKLRIIGYGSDENRNLLYNLIPERASKNQLEILDFSSEILRQYQEASVFVLSSRYEGFGMVLLEAMSQGCACISCDYKGRQKEIISSNKEGILIEPNNCQAIEVSLRCLLQDTERQRTMQINAIEYSKQFTLNQVMNVWSQILNS